MRRSRRHKAPDMSDMEVTRTRGEQLFRRLEPTQHHQQQLGHRGQNCCPDCRRPSNVPTSSFIFQSEEDNTSDFARSSFPSASVLTKTKDFAHEAALSRQMQAWRSVSCSLNKQPRGPRARAPAQAPAIKLLGDVIQSVEIEKSWNVFSENNITESVQLFI